MAIGHDAAGAAGSAASRAVDPARCRRPRRPPGALGCRRRPRSGAFSTNLGLPSFLLGLRRAPSARRRGRGPSRARSAATSMASDVSSSTRTVPRGQDDLDGGRRREVRPAARPAGPAGETRRPVPGEAGLVQPDDPGGDAPAVGHPLLGAEPADLRDQPLHVCDPGGGHRIRRRPGVDRPRRHDDRLPTRQRLPQRLGDERHDRVQQPQQRVEDVPEHGTGAVGRGGIVGRSCTLASSRYQSHSSSHVKW